MNGKRCYRLYWSMMKRVREKKVRMLDCEEKLFLSQELIKAFGIRLCAEGGELVSTEEG